MGANLGVEVGRRYAAVIRRLVRAEIVLVENAAHPIRPTAAPHSQGSGLPSLTRFLRPQPVQIFGPYSGAGRPRRFFGFWFMSRKDSVVERLSRKK